MACWGRDNRTDTSSYYSTLWHKQREKALERDDYRCTVCGISHEEHRERFGRGVEVHHLVPVRLFKQWEKPPEHAHVLRNLVTVCRTHHPDAPGTTVDPQEEKKVFKLKGQNR
ncbi:MAG: HNH endonuclease [Halanaeroarchaeum sp.]